MKIWGMQLKERLGESYGLYMLVLDKKTCQLPT